MKEKTPPGIPEKWDDLQVWQVAPEIPARFQSGVWQKIAARQAEPSLFKRLSNWVTLVAARPGFAMALVVSAGLLGGSLAQVEARHANARSSKMLESRYIASIDPYAHLAGAGGLQ